jgi:hypothetical protein
MEKITLNGKTFYDWSEFLKISGLKNRKSIYDWVRSGKAEVTKIGSASFYCLK